MPGWIMAPSGMFNLRSPVDRAVLKLARREPEMGGFLSGLYREAAKWEGKLPKGWTDESVKKFWNTMTGDVKHKVTKCMKEMDGKGLDTGAFCASLADKVEGTAWRHKKRKTAEEQEDSDLLEDLAGGPRRAFQMMDLWKKVQNLGTRYDRLMDPERYDPVRNFILRARRERFSDDAIRHYVENIQGSRLPRDWKRIKAATTVARRHLARKEVWVDVRDLPLPIQKALKSVKYGRKNIQIQESRTYQMSGSSGDGRKAFTIAVNLGTGKYQIEWGSWGGPNMFNPQNSVDLDTKPRPIPPNNVVISGNIGGRTWAYIEAHPDNLTKLLGAGDDDAKLTEQQMIALSIIGGIKGGYRREYFERNNLGDYSPENPLVISLAKLGLINVMRNGAMKITTKGQNVRGGMSAPYGKYSSEKVAVRYLRAKYIVVTPAYGRDYPSKAKAIADWDADKDFILQDITSRWDGKPINKSQAQEAGFSAVNIRYKRNTQVAVVKLAKTALQVDPLPAYQGEKIKQSIEFHNREADDSAQMADDIEKAWKKWDLRTLGSYQVLSRREVQYVQKAMATEDSSDDRYLGEIGRSIGEHIDALRQEAADHRKEADIINKAWQKKDLRTLKRMRVVAATPGFAMIIHENGQVEETAPANGKNFNLRELQKIVKGMIEIVRLGKGMIMVVNEEGLLKRMQPNSKASQMAKQPIVGPAVFCDSRMVK